MFDSALARRMMVDGQVRTADVHNPELIAAMLEVPRERFVPQPLAEQAYVDGELDLGRGRTMLAPMVFAKLVQAAQLSGREHVLDVGCGLGYSSAILARLAGSVVALEEDADLARQAKAALAGSGAAGVVAVQGPLGAGWPAAAPYDFILLNGATEIVPDSSWPPAQAGRTARLYFRSRAGGQGHDCSAQRKVISSAGRFSTPRLSLCRASTPRQRSCSSEFAGAPALALWAAVTRRLPVAHMCHCWEFCAAFLARTFTAL